MGGGWDRSLQGVVAFHHSLGQKTPLLKDLNVCPIGFIFSLLEAIQSLVFLTIIFTFELSIRGMVWPEPTGQSTGCWRRSCQRGWQEPRPGSHQLPPMFFTLYVAAMLTIGLWPIKCFAGNKMKITASGPRPSAVASSAKAGMSVKSGTNLNTQYIGKLSYF